MVYLELMLHKFYDGQEGLYGYKNEDDVIVIPAIYEEAEDFDNKVAAVYDGINWGIIDDNGVPLVPFEYDHLFTSRSGWIHGRKESKQYLFNQLGILQLELDDILYWHFPEDGLIRVKKETGWGCIDLNGSELIPFFYKSLGPYKNQRLSYYCNGKWGWLDKTGAALSDAIFDEVGFWNNEFWWARINNSYQLFNYTNQLVLDEGWLKIIPPLNDVAAVKTALGWKYINPDFSTLLQLPAIYEWVELYKDGLAAGKRNGKWGFIDTAGHEVIAAVYEMVRPFSEGRAAVKKDGLWGFIDEQGLLKIPCIYQGVASFYDEKAWVTNYYYSWYINKDGVTISAKEELEY